jgi:hypothetical protein
MALIVVQLLWERIESAYNEKQYDRAEKYCNLALHRLFERCGELNHAKIARCVLKEHETPHY